MNDTDREQFDFDRPERCEDCGLESEQCNCDKELDDVF